MSLLTFKISTLRVYFALSVNNNEIKNNNKFDKAALLDVNFFTLMEIDLFVL